MVFLPMVFLPMVFLPTGIFTYGIFTYGIFTYGIFTYNRPCIRRYNLAVFDCSCNKLFGLDFDLNRCAFKLNFMLFIAPVQLNQRSLVFCNHEIAQCRIFS